MYKNEYLILSLSSKSLQKLEGDFSPLENKNFSNNSKRQIAT